MNRSTVIVCTLTGSALLALAGVFLPARLSGQPTERPDRPNIDDAPLGWVACERLPLKKPETGERTADALAQPYRCVVDVLDWPTLEPRSIEARQIEIPGASSVQLLRTGRCLVSGIGLGMNVISLLAAEKDLPDRLVELGTGRRGLLTQRNPVAFARHAITHCELVVMEADDLAQETPFKGRVFDRWTRAPLEGALVLTGKQNYVLTDAEGRFHFEQPMTLQEAFSTGIEKEGYTPFTLTLRALTVPWCKHWQETGEMIVTLGPTGNAEIPRPFPVRRTDRTPPQAAQVFPAQDQTPEDPIPDEDGESP